jgi:hypothetical protein
MDRFSKFQPQRFFTEVDVAGFDLDKSIANAQLQKQKHKQKLKHKLVQQQTRQVEKTRRPLIHDPTPVIFGKGSPSTPTESKVEACQPFHVEL